MVRNRDIVPGPRGPNGGLQYAWGGRGGTGWGRAHLRPPLQKRSPRLGPVYMAPAGALPLMHRCRTPAGRGDGWWGVGGPGGVERRLALVLLSPPPVKALGEGRRGCQPPPSPVCQGCSAETNVNQHYLSV